MSQLSESSLPTIEARVGEKLAEIREISERKFEDAKAYVQIEPEKSIIYAVVFGFILRLLPIGGLVRLLANLVLFVIKPLAVFYGVAKTYEILQRSKE